MDITATCKLLFLHNICTGLLANTDIYHSCRLLRGPSYRENGRAKEAETPADLKLNSQHWGAGRF